MRAASEEKRVRNATPSHDRSEGQRCRPVQPDEHAEIGGDALATPKVEPGREDVAEEGGEPGIEREVRVEPAGDEHGRRAFQCIEQQGEGGKPLVAGAQHIGRADIAGADLADVAKPGGARDQQAERDRAEQIAEHQRGQYLQHRSSPH